MRRYFGALIFAMLVIVTLVPIGLEAAPTRGPEANLSGVGLDGMTSPGGEHSVGSHQITITVSNSGDTILWQEFEFWVNVTYLDGTPFAELTQKGWLSLTPGMSTDVPLGAIAFPEGMFNISVNTTVSEADHSAYAIFSIKDVVELSIEYVSISEGMEYPLGEMMTPTCDILFDGNVPAWADDVTANLQIVKGTEIIYDSTVVVMEKTGTPQDPPYTFLNVAFQGWIPDQSGEMVATFTLPYSDSNMTDNIVLVHFTIAEPPSIEGIVTFAGTPVPEVLVELLNGDVLVWSNVTDAQGHYAFYTIDAGEYTLNFSKRWAETHSLSVIVEAGNTTIVDVEIVLLDQGSLGGIVKILPELGLAVGATVTVVAGDGSPEPYTETVYTDSLGSYYFSKLDAGLYVMTVTLSGYEPSNVNKTVLARIDNAQDFELAPVEFKVLKFTPLDGEMGWPVDGIVSVELSRKIDNTTIDNISLKNLESMEQVDFLYNLSEDLMTVTMDPVANLDYNTYYRIEVGTFLKDANGEYFPAPDWAEFRTEAIIVPVTLTSDPSDGSVDVAVNVNIVVTFSAEMDPDSITSTSFRVLENELTPVIGTIDVSADGRTVTFDPVALLDYGTSYLVDIKNTISPVDSMYTFNGSSFLFDTLEQVTTGIVKGRVLNEDGKAFSPSLVKVTLKMGTTVRTAAVNNNGNFTFTDVPPGTWTLTVTIKDYKTYTKTIAVTAGGTANAGTNLMKPDDKGNNNTWIYIVVGVLLLIFVVVVVYLYMRKRDEEGYEEPAGGYGGLRRYGGGYGGYDEMAEGEFLCPNCQSVVGPEEEVCGSCGAEFERDIFECPECGTTIPGDAPKCPECNADFQVLEEGVGEEDYLDSEEEKEVDVSGEYEVSPLDDEPEYIGMKED